MAEDGGAVRMKREGGMVGNFGVGIEKAGTRSEEDGGAGRLVEGDERAGRRKDVIL